MSLNKRKEEWLRDAPSDVLARIIEHQGDKTPTPTHPLAGIAHIEGIGQVPVSAMKRELAGRKEQE